MHLRPPTFTIEIDESPNPRVDGRLSGGTLTQKKEKVWTLIVKSYSELWNAIDHQRLIGEMRLGIKYKLGIYFVFVYSWKNITHQKFMVLAEPTALEEALYGNFLEQSEWR